MTTPDSKVEIAGIDQILDVQFKSTFEQRFQLYFKPLCFFCQYRFGVSIDEAKDIVHSAYTRLYESQLTFISEQSAKSYLYKLTGGICIDFIRRESLKQRYQRSSQQKSFSSNSTINEEALDFKQLRQELNEAIEELPPQMRQVFELSRHDGLKYSEIALTLGVSKKTVETQISRALARLRQRLASYL